MHYVYGLNKNENKQYILRNNNGLRAAVDRIKVWVLLVNYNSQYNMPIKRSVTLSLLFFQTVIIQTKESLIFKYYRRMYQYINNRGTFLYFKKQLIDYYKLSLYISAYY